MKYKTIVLELLQQNPSIHQQLCTSGLLRQTMDQYATALKACHESWTDQLAQARPESDRSQLSSEAMEIALQELQDSLPPASLPSDVTPEPLTLDAAMNFLRRHTPTA